MSLETQMKSSESPGQIIKSIYIGISISIRKFSYALIASLYKVCVGINIIINSDSYR